MGIQVSYEQLTLVNIKMEYTLKYSSEFPLECGASLPELDITYHTFGERNAADDNIIWICHALTANADALDWWEGLVGENALFDPSRYFIVCANIIGSCYGSTGPQSVNPETEEPYAQTFPVITIRDMVKAHQILQKHLGIQRIKLIMGGSMGGQQALEWAIMDPNLFESTCILASNAQHSPWGIAFNEAQRMAILADESLYKDVPNAGQAGLEAARAVAMLSYRNYHTYHKTQAEETDEKVEDFKASSYQRYQGLKLYNRFHPWSYLSLSKSMDSHNVGRGRGGILSALKQIKARTLVISIRSDVLFPEEEQILIAEGIPDARLETIDSLYGHDGFLIETEAITEVLNPFLEDRGTYNETKNYKLKLRPNLNGSSIKKKKPLPGTELF